MSLKVTTVVELNGEQILVALSDYIRSCGYEVDHNHIQVVTSEHGTRDDRLSATATVNREVG